jgi:hypothetical protein
VLTVWYSTSQDGQDSLASLRRQTVELYSQILKYQIQLAVQYSRPRYFRLLRDIAVIDKWGDMLVALKKKKEDIDKILGAFGSKSLRAIENAVSELKLHAEKSLSLLVETKAYVKVWIYSGTLGKSISQNSLGYQSIPAARKAPSCTVRRFRYLQEE